MENNFDNLDNYESLDPGIDNNHLIEDNWNETSTIYDAEKHSGEENSFHNEGTDVDTHLYALDEFGIYHNTFHPSFGAKEDMLPYDEKVNFGIHDGIKDPFGIYAMRLNRTLDSPDDLIQKPHIPIDFTQKNLQQACDQMCDILNIRHLPVIVTKSVPNAAHTSLSGPFRFTLVDDYICFNPHYAEACIEQIGNTDIILSDLAHEIGHALASKYCGNLSVTAGEKVADFISGYLNYKMGVDIDAARQWFLWQYDPIGENDYPVSEERWDIEGGGYYFAHYIDSNGLKTALKDPDFLKLILSYRSEDVASLSLDQWSKMNQDSRRFSDQARNMFYNIKKYLLIKQF